MEIIGGIYVTKYHRYMTFIAADTILILFSVIYSYILINGRLSNLPYFEIIYMSAMVSAAVISVFYSTKMYRQIWKYTSVSDISQIIKNLFISLILFSIFHLIVTIEILTITISPFTIFLIWISTIFSILASRFIYRLFHEKPPKLNLQDGKRILIIGAGSAGALVVKELRNTKGHSLSPVAFIDDDSSKLNLQIMGVPVVGSRDKIVDIVNEYNIDIILIAFPSVEKEEVTKIINICSQTKTNIKTLPRLSDIINGKITLNMIQDVKVEDLLGRAPNNVDINEIADFIKDQVILVTGAGGSIGSEICRQISKFEPKKILLLGHGENSIYNIENELNQSSPNIAFKAIIADIQDKKRLENVFSLHQPKIIFHAAAHKHVPLMEYNPIEAIKNNVFGTKNIVECSHQFKAERFVLISTDKAVNPTSIMGVTKRIAELIIQNQNENSSTNFVAVRFGNVLGSRGSVIPLFKKQIQSGGPVTVTHPEMTRYFMTIPEAVQLVIQAASFAEGGEIFILDMGQPVKISDLARDIITLSGLIPDKDIMIKYTGIRPGEKLFEEILSAEEGNTASKHHLIYKAKPLQISRADFESSLENLKDLIQKEESKDVLESIRLQLQKMVPGYQNQNVDG